MMVTHQEMLSLEEAAEFLGVTPYLMWEYVRRWVVRGQLINKEWWFNKADLLWLHHRPYAN